MLIDNIGFVVEVLRESVEIDFFQDSTNGLPPLPSGARLDPARGDAGNGLIVRFRVLVQTERAGLRIAQMLSNPSKLQDRFIEAGLLKFLRRKQPSLVNTFLPMTLDASGRLLCDNVLYDCPDDNPKLNTKDVAREAGMSLNALSIAVSSSSALCGFVHML